MDDRAIASLLDAAFDFLCERRASELVDAERLLGALDAAATEPRVARALARWVAPARARLLARLRASETRLSAWLPASARAALLERLSRPAPVPRALIDELVASARVRDAVRELLKETLQRFIEKAIAVAPGGAGLRGVIGIAGGLFGALGEEVQRLLQERVRDFVDTGVAVVQKRLAERLSSEETARMLGERRRRAFEELLERKESEVARWLDEVPFADLDALAPAVTVHNLARAEVREALRAEVQAAIADLASQPVGALLDELGLRDRAREALRAHGLPLVRDFLASPHYARWRGPATG